MIEHFPDDRFRLAERSHLHRLGLSADPAAGAATLTARERVLLYRLGAAIPEGARAAVAGTLTVDALTMVTAGVSRRFGQVELERGATTDLPESLAESVIKVTESVRRAEPVHLLVLGDDSPVEAARLLARTERGAIVAAVNLHRCEALQGIVRDAVVPRQTEGGRTADRVYWSRVDQSRRPWCLQDPHVSVIIPTHDREDFLIDALDSVARQQAIAGAYELLVVENAPSPRLGPRITEFSRSSPVAVRYVHEPRPGLHHARHRGALEAHGSILVYVDDDVLAPPGWLDGLVAPFADRSVAIVGGPVRPLWEVPPPDWVAGIPDSYFSLLDLGDREQELRYPDGAYGCNMAIRRDTLFEVGGFNPDAMGWDHRLFWLRGDGETGLHLKVAQAGYRVLYVPSAGLMHRMPASRVTPRAIRHRGLLVGLSHSFAGIRTTPGDRSLRLRLLVRAARSLRSSLRSAVSATASRKRQLHLCDSVRAFGFARQHLAAAIRPSVLRYIRRPTFFTENVP
jgi:GT2 family glycosyltransferase